MPKYFAELEKLGSIPYYEKKEKRSLGQTGKSKMSISDKREFVDILRTFHTKRVEELYTLGWILN